MHFVVKAQLFAAMALMLLISCTQHEVPLTACPVKASLDVHGISKDVCPPHEMEDFGNMAWQTFKTLVWPASSRGVADRSRKITDKDRPLVFETYKADWETFQSDKSKPLAWHRYPMSALACKNASSLPPLAKNALVLAAVHKFHNLDQRDIDPDGKYAEIIHILVAQNRTPVRYLSAFGEMAFNSIRDNKLYKSVDDIPMSDAAPKAGKTRVGLGTITIKTAWIEMKGITDPQLFHVRKAWLQDPFKETCEEVDVGLVGFHIAHKTARSPQWIWASFEHVRNVPVRGEPHGKDYTFHNGRGAMPDHPPEQARLPIKEIPLPYNVERFWGIPKELRDVNEHWRKMMGDAKSVWANYELVSVQWAGQASEEWRTGAGHDEGSSLGASPTPPCTLGGGTNVSNSIIETFLQRHTICKKDLTCMSCHNKVRSFDFIFSIPLAHTQRGGFGPSKTHRATFFILDELVEQSRGQ